MLSDRPDFSDGWIKYYYENGNLKKEGMMKKIIQLASGKPHYLGKLSHVSTILMMLSRV